MQINKNNGRSPVDPDALKTASSPPKGPQHSQQAAKTGASSVQSALQRSSASLISFSGLPADKLSASIIAFARFFSLHIKPETLAAIRRQAFASAAMPQSLAPDNTPVPEAAAKIREALSLAASAAESKGVELQPEGLEKFAQAVDPDWHNRQQDQDGRRRKRHNSQKHDDEESAPANNVSVNAAGIKETALEAAGEDPLLAILNRLPGKNGQRWIVLPFNFGDDGRQFRVSLRILLEEEYITNRAICMALDIASLERRWLFVLEAAGGSPIKPAVGRLTVHVQPEPPQKEAAQLVRGLSALLEIPAERVYIKNYEESFPFESSRAQELLRAIDEAV